MKRILIFSLVYYPRFVGGAEVALKEITDRVSPEEIEFHMVTLRVYSDLPKREQVGNIIVHRVGFAFSRYNPKNIVPLFLSFNKYLFPFVGALKAYSLHRQKAFEAFWSSQANYAGFAALFFSFLKPRIPFILTLQEGDPLEHYKKRVGFFLPLYKKIFKDADRIQAISHFLAHFAESMGHKKEVVVIPNGVESEHFSTQSLEEIEAVKQKLGKGEDDIFLITTSRLVEKNGVGDIIQSLTMLPAQIKLLILGTGPLEEHLKEQSEKLGLQTRVIFLGYISHSKLPPYLHVSDIFIRPSLSEGMGNSFIEAMAAGLPVIATPVGGIVDFLFDPEKNPDKAPTGLFAEVKNPSSIAKQVRKLLENPALREQITLNARTLVRESYEWNTIAKQMKELVFKPFLR